MERYTYFEGGKWRLCVGDTEYSGPWVNRLAAYEDTGLTPEQIMGLCEMDKRAKMADILRLEEYGLTPADLSRAAELLAADKDGRCVVLDKPRKECSMTETEKAIQEFELEMQEQEIGCDWCQGCAADLVYQHGFSGEIIGNKLKIYHECVEGNGERMINFCPMCGRELTEN